MSNLINQTSPENSAQPNLFVIGTGSRLFKSISLNISFTSISGRSDFLDKIPEFPDGASIIIFSDPPNEIQTRALLLSVLSRIRSNSNVNVIYISSISAAYGMSKILPIEGEYARKKRKAEDLLKSRRDINLTILRAGNIFSHGGWKMISENCLLAVLPSGRNLAACTDPIFFQSILLKAINDPANLRVIDAWYTAPTNTLFKRVIQIPGLFFIYQSRPLQPIIKLLGRLLRLVRVYLPSPDDINAFLVKSQEGAH